MFALLFDRKSGILTLLALGAIGLMLFAAGLVTGVNVSWEKLASHMPHDRPQEPAAAPAPPAAAPEEEPAAAAWSRPRAEPRRNAPRESAEQAAFTRREPTSPPPGWVPLTEGAPWPGDEAAAASAPADPIVLSTPTRRNEAACSATKLRIGPASRYIQIGATRTTVG